jgi:tripartite-type tricarboxylate transporter receptor subunit TctC
MQQPVFVRGVKQEEREMKKRLLIGALSAVFAIGTAQATSYPDRPIRVLVGYSAGGAGDSIARIVTGAMAQVLGQPIVVENRAGAGSSIASNAIATAPKDGYTLGLATGNIYGVDQLVYKVSYTADDFTPINRLASYPLILAVNPEKGPKTFQEFMTKAKANPGTMFYSTSGIGGSPHTSAVMLQDLIGTEFTHVPFKGGNPALLAVAAGDVDFSMGTAPSVLPLGRGDRVRMLAVSSPERSALAPDLPTIAESGLPGFEFSFWFGLFGPAGLPPEVTKKLADATVVVLNDPEVQKRLIAAGSEAGPFASPAEFEAYARRNGAQVLEGVKKAQAVK